MKIDQPPANWRLLLPLAYSSGLFLLSSIPDTDAPASVLEEAMLWVPPTWQNVLHIPIYVGLGISWFWALEATLVNIRWRLVISAMLAITWGVLDEWHQSGVPGRYGSWTDALLNVVGVGLAAAWIVYTGKTRKPKKVP